MKRVDVEYTMAKFDTALAVSGKQTASAGEMGLTRTELRFLERKGLIERLRTETRKWKDVSGSIKYVYRKVNK